MRHLCSKIAVSAVVGAVLAVGGIGASKAETPKRGGTLLYVIPSNPPSADAHRETTFGTIHPFAQFYSVLIRVNPGIVLASLIQKSPVFLSRRQSIRAIPSS